MSILFTPVKLGNMEINNRFIHSATYEGMAGQNGEITDEIVKRYLNLSRGEVGLIIPGYMYVHPLGRTYPHQSGIHSDEMIPGLKKLTQAVHNEGGKIVFQLAHGGRQAYADVIGSTPLGPSSTGRDPVFFVKPRKMNEEDIQEVISSFGKAAVRAAEAGADGVQIHAAHGYLINQFLSPFFNRRDDDWGGTDQKRFRLLRDVIGEIKRSIPDRMPVLVKLNANDYTPRPGITPRIAARYAGWLSELGMDGLEISCGTGAYSFMNMCRGDMPVNEFIMNFPFWKKPLARVMMKGWAGKCTLEEGYNLEAARLIRPSAGKVPMAVVGGMRRVAAMTEIIKNGYADLISMCRPFIREPFIVKKIKEGRADAVSCTSCNRCLAAIANNMAVRCYVKGFPV